MIIKKIDSICTALIFALSAVYDSNSAFMKLSHVANICTDKLRFIMHSLLLFILFLFHTGKEYVGPMTEKAAYQPSKL